MVEHTPIHLVQEIAETESPLRTPQHEFFTDFLGENEFTIVIKALVLVWLTTHDTADMANFKIQR